MVYTLVYLIDMLDHVYSTCTSHAQHLAALGVLHLKPPKFEHIFVAVIPFSPLFYANIFDTSLLLIVFALR